MAVSRGQAPPPSTPLMPIVWTQQTVRALSPARLGRGVRLDILLLDRGLELSLTPAVPWQVRALSRHAGWVAQRLGPGSRVVEARRIRQGSALMVGSRARRTVA